MAASLGSELRLLLRSMSAARRRQLALVALLMSATAIAEMAMVASIVPFLALLAARPVPGHDLPLIPRLLDQFDGWVPANPILAAAMLFAAAVLAMVAFRLILAWVSQQFSFGLGHELAVETQRRLLHQPYAFHLQRHSSELLTTLDKIDYLIFSTALQGIQAISAALVSLFVIAALLWIDPISAVLAALLIGGLYGLTIVAARRRLASHAAVIRAAFEARLKSVQNSLGGIRDVILDRAYDARVERFREIDSRFMTARADAAFLVAAPRFLVEGVGLVLIAMLAVTIAGRPGGLIAALPTLGALALGAQRLLPLMSQIYAGWASMASSRPIICEIADLIRMPLNDEADPANPPLPLRHSITLEQVGFQYDGRVRPALHDIDVTIPKGSRVAVTGPSGSGKSTLADLLMGLIEPSHGTIRVDGAELTGERLTAWRRSIAHVPQAIFLTDESIAGNIALSAHGSEIDLDRVRRAADTAQLSEFIESLPNSFDTSAGERGVRLSGGQRQRLALARAIYKDTPVLVLDEATSALDDETERAILRALSELQAAGRTIIIIAHRSSTIEGCDLLLRLDHGRLVENGGKSQPNKA